MAATGAQSLSIGDSTDLVGALEQTHARGLGLIGNVPVADENGTFAEGRDAAAAVLARVGAAPGHVLGLGGPLPYTASEAWLDGVLAARAAHIAT